MSSKIVHHDTLRNIDTWFASQGFPLFTRERRDVSIGFLAVYVVEAALVGIKLDHSMVLNLMSFIGGPIVLVAALLLLYVILKDRHRWLILLILMTVPALPAIVLRHNILLFLLLVVGNYGLFAVLMLRSRKIGIAQIVRWALTEIFQQLPLLSGAFMRALPVLLVALIILFFTAEIWQAAHQLDGALLFLPPAALLMVGVAVQIAHFNQIIRDYWKADDPDWQAAEMTMNALCSGLGELRTVLTFAVPKPQRQVRRLKGVARTNVLLLLLFAQGLQLTVICVGLGLFLLGFGVLALPLETQARFVGATDAEMSPIIPPELIGREVSLTASLTKVVLFLGAIAYVSFVLHVTSDEKYFETFLPLIETRIKSAIVVEQFCDCVFWRPRIWRSSKGVHGVDFMVPAGVKTDTAVLVWKQVDSGSEQRTDMLKEEELFRTTLQLKAGSKYQYHYEINGTFTCRDCVVDGFATSDGGVDESVLDVRADRNR